MKKLSYFGLLLILSFQAYAKEEENTYTVKCHVVDFSGYYDLNKLAELGKKDGNNYFNLSLVEDLKENIYRLGLCDRILINGVSTEDKLRDPDGNRMIKGDAVTHISRHSSFLE